MTSGTTWEDAHQGFVKSVKIVIPILGGRATQSQLDRLVDTGDDMRSGGHLYLFPF